ncbi:hypothetical protein BDF19DRAFT_347056, partial [Syncephalis fuscata]
QVSAVTGANTGIEYNIALDLARHGSRGYFACRSKGRALAAIEQLNEDLKQNAAEVKLPDIHFLHLNLANLKQVDIAAKKLLEVEPCINILVNNTGISMVPLHWLT